MKRLIIFTVLLWVSLSSMGQGTLSSHNKKAIGYYADADYYYVKRKYPEAIALLQQALKRDDNFIEAHMRIAACYKNVEYLDRAAFHYNRAIQLGGGDRKSAIAHLALGEIKFKSREYQDCITHINQYLSSGFVSQLGNEKSSKLLVDAAFASENIKDSLNISAKPLPAVVNRFALQYFPVLTADAKSLIFTGRLGHTPEYDENIYICYRTDSTWSEPFSISQNINSYENEGTCTVSADGKMLIFTSCSGRQGFGSCDLYASYKTGGIWSVPTNLGNMVNSTAWESQPSLSADGRTLYFVSNRKGGFGKTDIWVTTLDQDKHWKTPINLGPGINTENDEVSPFIHVNGQTLYFSSNGFPGFGGYDLYYTERTNQGWTKPANLGYPINNGDDQVSLYISADGETGYYSYEAILPSRYRQSILVEFVVPEQIAITHKSNYVTGAVYDAETKKTLDARVELYDINNSMLVSSVKSDEINGEYFMVLTEGAEYALYAQKPGYLFKSLSFNLIEKSSLEPVYIDIFLEKIKIGSITTLNNIFFDFDKYDLRPKSKVELQRVFDFLEENPQVKIQIEGHTDDQGSKQYNQQLSLNRAKSVHLYLVDLGIENDRLSFRGFGWEKPLAPNDSEANRQLNRRIEFRILK